MPRWKWLAPGFINLFLAPSFWASVVLGACSNKEYGRTDHGKGAKYNVEFVSANPTGPMHMGNARGGALGDCLAAVLDWSGYDVTREVLHQRCRQPDSEVWQEPGRPLPAAVLRRGKPIPRPLSAIRAATSRYWPVSLPRSTATSTLQPALGWTKRPFASEAFETLKNALVDYALPKNIAALKARPGQSTASITMSGSTRAPCTNPALSWML